LSLDLTEF